MESRPRTPAAPPQATAPSSQPDPAPPAEQPTIALLPSVGATGGPAAATSAVVQHQQSLDEISTSIHRSLALLHQIHCSVSSFTLSSQLTMLERLNGVMKELSAMHTAAEDCHIQIPIDVIRFIDEGQNPDEFTKDLINNCIQRNQSTKGKVDSFKAFRKHLLEEIADAYPEETEAYRSLRSASAAEARRLSQTPALLSNGDIKVKTEH